jgi:hypothetical protein
MVQEVNHLLGHSDQVLSTHKSNKGLMLTLRKGCPQHIMSNASFSLFE